MKLSALLSVTKAGNRTCQVRWTGKDGRTLHYQARMPSAVGYVVRPLLNEGRTPEVRWTKLAGRRTWTRWETVSGA